MAKGHLPLTNVKLVQKNVIMLFFNVGLKFLRFTEMCITMRPCPYAIHVRCAMCIVQSPILSHVVEGRENRILYFWLLFGLRLGSNPLAQVSNYLFNEGHKFNLAIESK